jgi:hypothetical protein
MRTEAMTSLEDMLLIRGVAYATCILHVRVTDVDAKAISPRKQERKIRNILSHASSNIVISLYPRSSPMALKVRKRKSC